MKELIAILTSDWHLRRYDRIWADRPEIRGDLAFGLEQLLGLCRQAKPKLLCLAGDITHEPQQNSYTIAVLREFLDRVFETGTEVGFVEGQHDKSDPPLLSAIHDRPIWLHNHQRDVAGICFGGLDYRRFS